VIGIANGFYTKMQERYGMDGNTTASVGKMEYPRCGFKFFLRPRHHLPGMF